jgi:hypothetical protein
LTVFVVAVDRKEAEDLAMIGMGHENRIRAEEHLLACKAPPTDPFYGNRFKIYAVSDRKGD